MSRSKQKGTSFERLIADGFAEALDDDRIDRAPPRGAADRGDIANVRTPHGKLAIECKNVAKMNLAGWVTEAQTEAGNADAVAGVVIHKRPRKGQFIDQYVTMTVREFLQLVWGVETEGRP
ncbi:putative PDDEXK endonuclease [Plantibacter sp. YIM 135249]|uniref:putative PDDEXK endonuclease n=1 Tax=Plantibacter sp. YIM 135249 TaxID=3423918 RepID=UPI003D353620